MHIPEHIFKALKTGVAVAAALVGVVVLLAGSVQVCLCDPDPDQCGSECHICAESAPTPNAVPEPMGEVSPPGVPALRAVPEACHHVIVSAGDLFAPSFSVSVPLVGADVSSAFACAFHSPHPLRVRPPSTAPPDSIPGVYLTTATRRYPLS